MTLDAALIRDECVATMPVSAPVRLRVGDVTCVTDRRGGLVLTDCRTLVVSDLHLEKGSSLARRGVFLPPYDSACTLLLLAAMVGEHEPERIVLLGDSFHDAHGASRLCPDDRALLSATLAGRETIWITGNHDPDGGAGFLSESGRLPGSISRTEREFVHRDVVFRHEPCARDPRPQIAGHLHPVARIVMRGRSLRRKCFATDGRSLVMPALGALTGGLNVRDRAYAGLFERRALTAHMIGETRVYVIAEHQLLGD